CAHFPGALAKGHDHVHVDGAKRILRARLFDRAAQAAEGDIDPTAEFCEQRGEVAYGVFQVRVFGQRAAAWRQYAADGGLIEQAIEQ
nr:hypothetical protein [Tanacetum cinerariifolium]